MAGAGAHDGEHPTGRRGLRGGRGDVGVDVADGHGGALDQAGPGGGLGGEAAGPFAQLGQGVIELFGGEVGEAGVQRGQEVPGGPGAVLVDPLVPGGGHVACLVSAQLPHDPVGPLDPAVGATVDLGVVAQYLQGLGELPFGGDPPAVAAQPGFAAFGGQGVDLVGLGLGGVVTPQLGPGVRAIGEVGDLAQGGSVGGRGQDRAGGEVDPDADDPFGGDPGRVKGGGNGFAQDPAVVLGVLQGGLRFEGLLVAGQPVGDDTVGVGVFGGAEFGAVADPDHDGASGEGSEVDTDHYGAGGRFGGTRIVGVNIRGQGEVPSRLRSLNRSLTPREGRGHEGVAVTWPTLLALTKDEVNPPRKTVADSGAPVPRTGTRALGRGVSGRARVRRPPPAPVG